MWKEITHVLSDSMKYFDDRMSYFTTNSNVRQMCKL